MEIENNTRITKDGIMHGYSRSISTIESVFGEKRRWGVVE